jgi:hypothetical protein
MQRALAVTDEDKRPPFILLPNEILESAPDIVIRSLQRLSARRRALEKCEKRRLPIAGCVDATTLNAETCVGITRLSSISLASGSSILAFQLSVPK